MVKGAIGFVAGSIASFMHFLGSGYIDTALRGFIGGAAGYLGTVVITMAMQYLINKLNNNKKNNKTE